MLIWKYECIFKAIHYGLWADNNAIGYIVQALTVKREWNWGLTWLRKSSRTQHSSDGIICGLQRSSVHPEWKNEGKEEGWERERERELTCLREVQRSPLSVLQTHLSPTEHTQNSIWNISPSLCSHSFLQLILSLLTPCSIKDSKNRFHNQYLFKSKTCLKQAWKKYIY